MNSSRRTIMHAITISLLIQSGYKSMANPIEAMKPADQDKELNNPSMNLRRENINKKEVTEEQNKVNKHIQAVSVKLIGPVNGSGVIINSLEKGFKVLTAWHVLKHIRPYENIIVMTADSEKHKAEYKTISRIGDSDMATINFFSRKAYSIAKPHDVKYERNLPIIVSGYPAKKKSLDFNRGWIVFSTVDFIGSGNPNIFIDQGYQITYSNNTQKGMSGGGIFTTKGQLIGIHGRGELDRQATKKSNSVTKTGVSYGMPISLLLNPANSKGENLDKHEIKDPDALTLEISLEIANNIREGEEHLVIALADSILSLKETYPAYYLKHRALASLKENEANLEVLNRMLRLEGITRLEKRLALVGRSGVYQMLNQVDSAIDDQKELLTIAETKDEEAEALLSIGNFLDKKKQYEIANTYFAKVEEMLVNHQLSDEQSFSIYQSAAGTSVLQKKYAEAEYYANKAMEYNTHEQIKHRFNLFIAEEIYPHLNKVEEALQIVNEALKKDSLDMDALHARSTIYMHTRDAIRLEENALLILDLKPRDYMALSDISMSYLLRENIEKACFYYHKANYERGGAGFYKDSIIDQECAKHKKQ